MDKSSPASGEALGASATSASRAQASDGPEGDEFRLFKTRTRPEQGYELAANVEKAGSRPQFTMGAIAPMPPMPPTVGVFCYGESETKYPPQSSMAW